LALICSPTHFLANQSPLFPPRHRCPSQLSGKFFTRSSCLLPLREAPTFLHNHLRSPCLGHQPLPDFKSQQSKRDQAVYVFRRFSVDLISHWQHRYLTRWPAPAPPIESQDILAHPPTGPRRPSSPDSNKRTIPPILRPRAISQRLQSLCLVRPASGRLLSLGLFGAVRNPCQPRIPGSEASSLAT